MVTITIKQLLDIGINGACEEFPPGNLLMLPQSGGVTLCKHWNLIRCFFLQLIPAMLVDLGLRIKGMKPR